MLFIIIRLIFNFFKFSEKTKSILLIVDDWCHVKINNNKEKKCIGIVQ